MRPAHITVFRCKNCGLDQSREDGPQPCCGRQDWIIVVVTPGWPFALTPKDRDFLKTNRIALR